MSDNCRNLFNQNGNGYTNGCGCGTTADGCCQDAVKVRGVVDLARGAQVSLNPNSAITLAPGTTVGLRSGTTVSLTPGSSIGLTRTISEENLFSGGSLNITADGTYYTDVFDVYPYEEYTWYLDILSASSFTGTIMVYATYSPSLTSRFTRRFYTDTGVETAEQYAHQLTPQYPLIIQGRKGIRYGRLVLEVSQMSAAGGNVLVGGYIQGERYTQQCGII